MALDPDVKTWLDQLNASPVSFDGMEPAFLRQFMDLPFSTTSEPVLEVHDQHIDGPLGVIPLRIYRATTDKSVPTIVFFHGGGFVFCTIDSHDALCRMLANRLNAVVVSVGYRLAPEAKFPAAPNDCFAAVRWAAEHIDKLGGNINKLLVAGDSAGGNLATVVCHMAKNQGPKIAHQLLFYPVIDGAMNTPSYQSCAEGYFLSRHMMEFFWLHYLENAEQAKNPLASPINADCAGLPPATIITAEFDPLCDEGEAYAAKLKNAGVSVSVKRYDGLIHGFLSLTDQFSAAKKALDEVCVSVKKALA